jgi:hypothetical protein
MGRQARRPAGPAQDRRRGEGLRGPRPAMRAVGRGGRAGRRRLGVDAARSGRMLTILIWPGGLGAQAPAHRDPP